MSTFIIRNPDQTIHHFAERGDDIVLSSGQTIEELSIPFPQYAIRLILSVDGLSGQAVFVPAGPQELFVQVFCPGQSSIELDLNGEIQTISLANGLGQLVLNCQTPARFLIQPADRRLFPASGSSLLAIVVEG